MASPRGLLAMLVFLLLGQTGFAVLFNQLTGEFTSALAAKDADRFWTSIIQCLGIPVSYTHLTLPTN